MKTIITLAIAILVTPFAMAETKEELSEKVIKVSNAELDFTKATSTLLDTLKRSRGDDNIDELYKTAREYYRTNSVKPLYVSALNDTFTKEELILLIKYYESLPSEYEGVLRKLGGDFQVNFALEKIEWTEGLFDLLNTEKSPDQLYIDKVMDEQESGNYTNAFQMVNEKIQNEEWKLQFLYRLRADCHFEFKEFEKARDDFIRALPRSKKRGQEKGSVLGYWCFFKVRYQSYLLTFSFNSNNIPLSASSTCFTKQDSFEACSIAIFYAKEPRRTT